MQRLLAWLDGQPDFERILAIGHRVVHGGIDQFPQRRAANVFVPRQAGLPNEDPAEPSPNRGQRHANAPAPYPSKMTRLALLRRHALRSSAALICGAIAPLA